MKFNWKIEENKETGEKQMVARTVGILLQAGSTLIQPKKGTKPYYLNALNVTDEAGLTEPINAMFYPGTKKNILENLQVGLPYLTRVIRNKGEKTDLFTTSGLVSGKRILNDMSDEEFDALWAELEAEADAEAKAQQVNAKAKDVIDMSK